MILVVSPDFDFWQSLSSAPSRGPRTLLPVPSAPDSSRAQLGALKPAGFCKFHRRSMEGLEDCVMELVGRHAASRSSGTHGGSHCDL